MGRLLRDRDLTDPAPPLDPVLVPVIECLDTATDGTACVLELPARNGNHAAALLRRAAAHAHRHGYVAIDLDTLRRRGLPEGTRDRALVILASPATRGGAAALAFMDAAAGSPRPRVLLTVRPQATAGILAREARTAYGVGSPRRLPLDTPMTPDVLRHLQRATRAPALVRSGRHAAAERLLRDVAGALARRHAWAPASRTWVQLARMLAERARIDAADAACEEGAACAARGDDVAAAAHARIWQAMIRTETGRLTDAEAICRAALATALPGGHVRLARAALAQVLLLQERTEEARQLDLTLPGDDRAADEAMEASIADIQVRLLLATGATFEAGGIARGLLDAVESDGDPLARTIARLAHLRVIAACGDLRLAAQLFDGLLLCARAARAPLRLAWGRVVWHDMLVQAGAAAQAREQRACLARVCRAAPRRLRHAVEERLSRGEGFRVVPAAGAARVVSAPSGVAALVRMAQEDDDDREALRRLLQWIVDVVRAGRVDLVSADAGPATTLLTAGAGLATRLGPRVLDAGMPLSGGQTGGQEAGVPVRLGSRLIGAIVCRWPLPHEPPTSATAILEIAAAIGAPRLEGLLAGARKTALEATAVPELVGASAAIADVRRAIARAATAPFAVLIEGESGSGKELVARAIHQLGPRRLRRFCDLNCAALPDDLLDAELFGHARGAFTGAVAERPGLFEEASGGTLFLDELPDLSPRGQAKLLRVLQQQEVRRVGETFNRPIDVRLIAATNRDMRAEVQAGRFRQDLLYRVDVIRIAIPPLRDRPEDVAMLARHFWERAAARVHTHARLTHGLLAALAQYAWPGNVRELENVMAALAVAAPARGEVRPALLPAAITGATPLTARRLEDARGQFERRFVEAALARAGGKRSRAAAELGLTRQGLTKMLERLGLGPADAGAVEQD